MMPDPGCVVSSRARRFRRRLGWVLVLGTLLVLGINCGGQTPRLGRGGAFNGGFRWSAGDTSRMLRNAHYFKLMGQPELGIKEMEEAHRLAPGNLEVADALARCYDELGMGAQAQQIYLEALALAPDNQALQNNLGFSYYQAGNWSQAETCYRQILTRQPNNQKARNNLGLLLCRQGRQEEARRLWQEAEGEAVARQRLGEALAALGMSGESRYAQQTRPHPQGQSSPRHCPAGGARPADPVTAGPPPSQASSPAVNHEIETGARPGASPPAVAAAELAAAPAPPPPASDSRPREILAAQTVEGQVSQVAALPHPPPAGAVAGNQPDRPRPPRSETAAAPPTPSPLREASSPARPDRPAAQPGLAGQPGPELATGKTSSEPPRANSRAPVTVRELVETNIAILNGNGIHHLARDTRSRLLLEGYNVANINNFRNFEVDRTVIYYRPEAERVALALNQKFFPRAELEPAPQLAARIDVQVVLGHDLGPQQQAEASKAHGLRL